MHDELMMYELETVLLGKLLLHPELYYQNAEKLEPDMFNNLFNKKVFEKFLVMQSEQKDIDLVSMSKALDCDQTENIALSSIFSQETTYYSVKSCIEQLDEHHKRQKLHAGLNEAMNMFLNNESVNDIIEHINKVNSKVVTSKDVDTADIAKQIKDFLIDVDSSETSLVKSWVTDIS